MAGETAITQLPSLDHERPAPMPAAVFQNNLAALAAIFPAMAAALREHPLPAHWRPALALDDCPTMRCEPPGAPAAWLDDSAAPQTRATELLRSVTTHDLNLALPSIGTGAELLALLAELPPARSVFVFENEPDRLAAVLRLHDLADALRSMRCVLIPWSDSAALEHLLDHHPGLEPPGQLICFRHTPPAQASRLREVCDRAAQRRASSPPVEPTPPTGGVALVYLGRDAAIQQVAEALTAEAGALGGPVTVHLADRPGRTDPHWHARVLDGRRADFLIVIDGVGPAATAGTCALWHTREPQPGASWPPQWLHLAATPQLAEALRARGVRAVDFWWPAIADDADPPEAAARSACLLADLPDDSAAACGISQPTHEMLWRDVQTRATAEWDRRGAYDAFALLRSAERATGIELHPENLRSHALVAIAERVIPAAVARQIARTLAASDLTVGSLGSGWSAAADLAALADPARGPAAIRDLPPRLLIVGGRRAALGPVLLAAAAAGWPLLVHDPGGEGPAASLRGVLAHNQHFRTFSGAAALAKALREWAEDPAPWLRRAATARKELRSRHSPAQRWIALADHPGWAAAMKGGT